MNNTKNLLKAQLESSIEQFAAKIARTIIDDSINLFEKMTDQEIEKILPEDKIDLSARILILAACENVVNDQIVVESAIGPAKAAKRILKKNRA